MKKKFIWSGILILCFFQAKGQRMYLHDAWQFSKAGSSLWYPATVPGTVHTDLMANGLIPDPFLASNETRVQWVDDETWHYQTSFTIHPQNHGLKDVHLVFEGLDTFADIYLNDSLVLKTNNMFRTWDVNITSKLHNETNKLLIVFHPAKRVVKEHHASESLTLEEEPRVFARKAQYHFGWDWGPKLITAGIWRPVYLQMYAREPFFETVSLKQQSLSQEEAVATLSVKAFTPNPTAQYQIKLQTISEEKPIQLIFEPKQGVLEQQIRIPRPKLWYPNGMGEAKLYEFTITLLENGIAKAETTKSLGFRKIELIQQSGENNRSFMFRINGQALFMKGANWIPAESFLPRLRPETYQSLIAQAKESNFNMLRIWGGGIYEDDAFYDACDRAGILVWQDFMFACALYPADQAFLNNVAEEARQQIQRLSPHTCIALWCGNNEIDEGWRNWGWQKRFGADTAKVWRNYQELFHRLLPDLLQELDPGRHYHPSSPQFGWGRKESMLYGDSHYWGVWWGMEPFEVYKEKTGRFMSEYGFQGLPSLQSLRRFIPEEELYLFSPALKTHQKHAAGYQTISAYMAREYPLPDTSHSAPHIVNSPDWQGSNASQTADPTRQIQTYAYISQLLQAYGIKTAIEAHRRAKPWCMGTLYWQFNDCWPVTSWSGLDYYGQWKALQYFIKKSFQETIISIHSRDAQTEVWLVTDAMKDLNGTLSLTLQDFNGQTISSKDTVVSLPANSAKHILNFRTGAWIKDSTANVLAATFRYGEQEVSQTHFFCTPKNLNLGQARFAISRHPVDSAHTIVISSDILTKNAYITYAGEEYRLNDNYMDMLPGQSIAITFPVEITDLEKIEIRSFISTPTSPAVDPPHTLSGKF